MVPSLRTHQSRSMRIGSPRRVAWVIGQSSAGYGDPSGCFQWTVSWLGRPSSSSSLS